ncbi:MAG: hypothetical protein PHR66_02100 [Desulfuromonadaceae bacterium]|nr:hypothetical protein [Desulfuromonadaceae bacterium]
MPIEAFNAIRGNIQTFLGGARVELLSCQIGESGEEGICEMVAIEEQPYQFTAHRDFLPFTRAERAFCKELLTAFAALYSGFRQQGYAAHFRTALLASIMDITVARSLRVDHNKGFWPIQQLIQLLKNLSYQRYEGAPATTGFIVYRTTQPNFLHLIRQRKHKLFTLKPSQSVSPSFFANPLTYRYVDATNLFFVANIQMQVTGIVRIGNYALQNNVERLTQRELFSIVNRSGDGAFAVTVNEASEIEVLTSPAKLLIRRKGGWAIFDPDIFRYFLGDSMEPSAADDLIWTAYALSKSRHGTVVLIHNKGARQLASLKKGSVGGDDPVGRLLVDGMKGHTITELKQAGTIHRILSSDGLTVFNQRGKLIETGFIIDTSHAREIVTGGGRTTAASAASFFGKVIKVSQDGPIELYQDGKQIYRFG